MTNGRKTIGNRLSRCARAPGRALRSARDFYVRSMIGCATRMHGIVPAAPMSFDSSDVMSRSSSFNSGRPSSGDEDFRELVRAVSQSRIRAAAAAAAASEGSMLRSQSVVAVRIDEDAPYEFSGDLKIGGSLIFPRSRSYAVGGKTAAAAGYWKYK
ncbi:hypothetical protein AXF42_Ash010372 [Apostasia shenzhenica]|uniref:Uncharacterized protein n=1 Tax=Apostasia shenzhenica TaxID=1088818 RepID=A0A2I0BDT5_9ASPA|nr:hypothetical protein AXF42_Ash010372 [Apostasia shenzhenica]